MNSKERVKLIGAFNKKLREGIALVTTIEDSPDVNRIKNKINLVLSINETLFLTKVGPSLVKHRKFIENKIVNSAEFIDNYLPSEDLEGFTEVENSEKKLFLELFRKMHSISNIEQKRATKSLVREMLIIYDMYLAMM
jgi:hypothetical protein